MAAAPAQIHCQGILFDMDGILVSSLAGVERAWTTWARMRGVDPALACHTAHGCRAVETVARLAPGCDAAAEANLIEELEIRETTDLEVLPGVRELLAQLPAERWTVVTSATERQARGRLEMGGIPQPQRFIHADCVRQGKPHPAPYLAGAALLGFRPQDCVVFEDAPSGARAGRGAGCTVVATRFSHGDEELAAAHYLIDDLNGVDLLPSLGGLRLALDTMYY